MLSTAHALNGRNSESKSEVGPKKKLARAWPGTCPAKVCPVYVCASASVVSAMVKRTAGARPIPMTWLRHWRKEKYGRFPRDVFDDTVQEFIGETSEASQAKTTFTRAIRDTSA